MEKKCDQHPKSGEGKLKTESAGNEIGGFTCAGKFTDEIGVGTEVSEGVADEHDRGDESELAEVSDAEAAGKDGDEQDGECLRCEAGKEKPD